MRLTGSVTVVNQAVCALAALGMLVGVGCRSAPNDAASGTVPSSLLSADEPAAAGSSAAGQAAQAPAAIVGDDYAGARTVFRTKLVRTGPAPQPWAPVRAPAGAKEIGFTSGGHSLRAWISEPKAGAAPAPAVLFLHGGFAFGGEDWDMAQPFAAAGFVVMTPILRGENGSPGAFSLFYDELDDVLAAAELLAKLPHVDPKRIYVSGHSIGGVLTMLASQASRRFRGAASLSGAPDPTVFAKQPGIPFDADDPTEWRMRSPLAFAASFRCPARLFYGVEETFFDAKTRETATRAKAAGLDVEAVTVEGDHFTMVARAIPRAIEFFQQQR